MKSPLLCLPLLHLIFLIGCSPHKSEQPQSTRSATDDLARTVALPAPPNRIISLAPSITETLFALRLDSAVVGVTDYCDFPDAARAKTRIGGMTSPDFETIIGLHPDLIVMTTAGNARKDFEKLTALGLTVFVSNPATLEDIYRSILAVGRLCDRVNEGTAIVEQLRSKQEVIVRIAAGSQPQTVLLLLSLRPLVSAGKGTFVDELLTLGNLRNMVHDSPTSYPLISREEVLSRQPDWIIVSDEVAQSIEEVTTAYPEWKTLRAIREGRVVSVGASLISRPGPRIIEGLEALVNATRP